MANSHALLLTLKNVLKSKGILYLDIAQKLQLNETSVKRFMSGHTPMTLDRLDQICEIAGTDVFSLLKLSKPQMNEELNQLSIQQEQSLADEPDLFLCFYGLAKGLRFEEIIEKYRITQARTQKAFHLLERLSLLEVLPGNKVKFLVSKTVRWRENGPLAQKFEKEFEQDFLNDPFANAGEMRKFLTFPLSERSKLQFTRKLKELISDLQTQSEIDLTIEKNLKNTSTFIIAVREWTPKLLAKYLK